MKKYTTAFFTIFSFSVFAQTAIPTWAEDIAPILYNNCTSCHHPGGAGHSSLITYNDAFNLAGIIEFRTGSKTMPPWPPEREYQHFSSERYLTDKQIALIKSWVDNGAIEGNPALAPPPPSYSNTSVISSPQLSAKIPTFTVPSNNDIYQCFVIPSGLSQDEFLTAIEILPGNSSIVHHVLVFQDTSGKARINDQNDPLPGYTNFGGINVNNPILIGAWVPGQQPYFYPSGMGVKIFKNADIVLQIHYPKNSLNQVDSTQINLKLSSNTSLRNVVIQPILNHSTVGPGSLINGPLVIPANQVKTFVSEFTNTFNLDFSVLSVAPHMHLIGKSIQSFAVTPTNDTIPFINIPNWDFSWQGQYTFQRFLKIPKNAKLYARATYDNTVNNVNNPNKANPQTVVRGESTTDEMMLVYFSFLVAQPGDENLIFDSVNYQTKDSLTDAQIDANFQVGIDDQIDFISTLQFYSIYPNPVSDKITATFYLPSASPIEWRIYNLQGKLVDQQITYKISGFNNMLIDFNHLSKGEYVLELSSDFGKKRKEFVVD